MQAAADLTAEDDERFAILSSQALRRYLEDELGLRSIARTSEEFLLSLKDNIQLDEFFQATLREVLANFDQIKFAQQPISITERIYITDTVERTHQSSTRPQPKGRNRPMSFFQFDDPAFFFLLLLMPILAWWAGRMGPEAAVRFSSIALVKKISRNRHSRPGQATFQPAFARTSRDHHRPRSSPDWPNKRQY